MNPDFKTFVHQAIFNLGGPTHAAGLIRVSPRTVHKWMSAGRIPKYQSAKLLASLCNCDIRLLRPEYPLASIKTNATDRQNGPFRVIGPTS